MNEMNYDLSSPEKIAESLLRMKNRYIRKQECRDLLDAAIAALDKHRAEKAVAKLNWRAASYQNAVKVD